MSSAHGSGKSGSGKWWLFLLTAGGALLADAVTKSVIRQQLRLSDAVPVIGDYLRLTFIFNPGAAFGISLGGRSREIFLVLTLIALLALLAMYHATPSGDRRRLVAIGLIAGGAMGNLWNRVAHPAGVIDWIDVGMGGIRWPVFNLADVAITTGAALLALSLWREGEHEDRVTSGASQ
jgi:signal peptidase II